MWQFLAYRNIYDTNFLSGGDLVVLKHSEQGGMLSADIDSNMQINHVFIRKYEGEFTMEEFSVLSVWEVENIQFINAGNKIQKEQ